MSLRHGLNPSGERVAPTFSGERAVCPTCQGVLVGHCGDILKWHWKHLVGKDCDPWAEPMTQWHILWQSYLDFYKGANTEVRISRHGEIHRADAVLPDGRIIELQHSSLSPAEINLRESFYGKNLVWIFDACEAYETKRLHLRKKDGKDTFRWKQPKKSIAYAKRKVFLDLGAGSCLELEKMYQTSPCGGFGTLHHSQDLEEFLNMNA